MGLFTGSKGKYKQISTLSKTQRPIQQQLENAVQQQGAGGAFGAAADYNRDLLSNDSQTFQQYIAPEMRRFNEDIIPGLSEQFAGMGAGGLSSSSFRNAAVNAGTDLSERLGAIRAQLRQQGAQGLQSLGQQSLQPTTENVYQAGQPGLLDYGMQALPAVATAALGPAGGAVANMASNWLQNKSKIYGPQPGVSSGAR